MASMHSSIINENMSIKQQLCKTRQKELNYLKTDTFLQSLDKHNMCHV